ncbi:MAG: hypothetical protein KJ749_01145 [Planctomycetes bacterium]|nr:hypothetical protein [Planctomycetota bacterium]
MNECSPGWFSGPETVILGSDIDCPAGERGHTFAMFSIKTEPSVLQHAVDVRLIIACRRRFGGLHTREQGARARLLLNRYNLDYFGLKTIPDSHTDYFHRDDRPLPIKLPEISGCSTLYQWSVPKNALLRDSAVQELEIRLDPAVRWDIDYVAILCATGRRKLSPIAERVFQFVVLVVVGGVAVGVLLKLLGL